MDPICSGGEKTAKSKLGPYLAPIAVLALSFGYAVGWGSFVMPGTMFLPGRAAILSCSRRSEPSAILSSLSRNMTYSPVACSSAVLRGAAGEPLRGCVNTEILESFAAYSRTISFVRSFDVSTTATSSQSPKGWLRTESKHALTYGSTSQHGTIMEKNGFMW